MSGVTMMKPTTVLDDADITAILHVYCNEPHGKVLRSVYPMDLSLDNLHSFWTRARRYPTLFSTEIRNDFGRFVSIFVDQVGMELNPRGLLWRVDDFVGVFYVTQIAAPHDAAVHFTFLDGRLRGRILLCREMLRYGFEVYNFRRLSTELPCYVSAANKNFVKHIGFKYEGRRRKSTMFKDTYFDSEIYGILREEILEE